MSIARRLVCALVALTLCAVEKPSTPKRPVTDTYHGVKVVDDYRWLENLNSKEVAGWIDAQNAAQRAYMNSLTWRSRMRKRVKELIGIEGEVTYTAGAWSNGRFFGTRRDPKLEQPQLVLFDDPRRPEDGRVVVDPNRLGAGGRRSFDWYRPSFDGRLVAVSISESGSEIGDLHVFDVDSGKEVERPITRVQVPTAGGDAAWTPDGRGIYYTRYPRDGERSKQESHFYQQLWFHRLGSDSAEDRYEVGRDFPRIAEIRVKTHSSGAVLALVQNGDGGEFFHMVKLPGENEWKRLTSYADRIVQLDWTAGGDLLAISRLGAPRGKLLLLSKPYYRLAEARTIVSGGHDVLVHSHYGTRTIVGGKDRVFVTVQTGGPSAVRVYSYKGEALPVPTQLPVAYIGSLVPVGETDLLFHTGSYFQPTRGRIFRAGAGTTVDTALGAREQEDFSAFEAVREFATSKDGTRVPVNILRRKGLKLDGSHPAVATGYGGYGLSSQPYYRRPLKALLEAGVVYAFANLRGGGEYGEEWHESGRLLRKQNVFDDFEAVLRHLIRRGYTSPKRLGIVGASNGGLLMGALITQRPDLVRAAVIDVGLLDMLRVELSPNGAFNTVEFGTVKEKAFFDVLYSYSPYHRVRDGVRYPSVLLTTGLHDGRVDAWHSLKMTARLQAASSSELPILLKVIGDAGHGPGMRLSTMIETVAEEFAFLLTELGVPAPSK